MTRAKSSSLDQQTARHVEKALRGKANPIEKYPKPQRDQMLKGQFDV
jgi:hypothetical protein